MNNNIIIENLGIETSLEKFVEDWELDINEINKELEEEGTWSDDFVEIEREDDEITIRILTRFWEVQDMVKSLGTYFLIQGHMALFKFSFFIFFQIHIVDYFALYCKSQYCYIVLFESGMNKQI